MAKKHRAAMARARRVAGKAGARHVAGGGKC